MDSIELGSFWRGWHYSTERALLLETFESDNQKSQERHFLEIEFDDLFGIQKIAESFGEITRLKKVLSFQFDMMHRISRSLEPVGAPKTMWLRRIRNLLRS